jgi:hypothetical protein
VFYQGSGKENKREERGQQCAGIEEAAITSESEIKGLS